MILPSSRKLGLALGIIFVLLGLIEVITHRHDTAEALAIWSLSLLGGGALVLSGTLLRPTHRVWGLTLLTIGALAGTNATVWTLIVPIFAIITVVAAYRDRGPDVQLATGAPLSSARVPAAPAPEAASRLEPPGLDTTTDRASSAG